MGCGDEVDRKKCASWGGPNLYSPWRKLLPRLKQQTTIIEKLCMVRKLRKGELEPDGQCSEAEQGKLEQVCKQRLRSYKKHSLARRRLASSKKTPAPAPAVLHHIKDPLFLADADAKRSATLAIELW